MLLVHRSLVGPCCGRMFHLKCLQQMALQAGAAHYKCPLCFDKDKFFTTSVSLGIYVPVSSLYYFSKGFNMLSTAVSNAFI